MWITPRPDYSLSFSWKTIEDNELFQLIELIPKTSMFGAFANLVAKSIDQNPLTYRILYKSKPNFVILAVSNNLEIINNHWNWLIDQVIPKIIECDWETRDSFIIPKITGMSNSSEEVEEDQNDGKTLIEFKTQFNINEKLITYYECSLGISSIPPKGKIYITQEKICYYIPTPEYRLLLPFHRITSINKENSLGFLPNLIKITACVGPDEKTESVFLFYFVFYRDQAYDMLEQLWKFAMEIISYENELERDLQLLEEQKESNNNSNNSNNNNNNSNNNNNNLNNNSSPTLRSITKNNLMIEKNNRNYQKTFKLPNNEPLLQVNSGWIIREGTKIFGEVYISCNYICCKYKDYLSGKKFNTVLHMSHIQSIEKIKPFFGISLFTDTIEIKTRTDREFLFRLFHCDEAIKTMKTYWSSKTKQTTNLSLDTVGQGYYLQTYKSDEESDPKKKKLIEDEKLADKYRFEMWEKYFKKKGSDSTMSITKTLTKLVHMGIPDTLRGHIWSFCSGACFQWERDSNYYETILRENFGKDSTAVEEIEKDVRRTFAHLPYFKSEEGINALRRVLVAYSWRNTEIGYCQGMNIVAANMLLYMREEAAFWVLARICEEFLQGYYAKEMIGSIVDKHIFTQLVQDLLPDIYKHLMSIGLPVEILALPWFMCLFISYIPIQVSNRVVDCFFLEGTTVLFQTGLAILKINKSKILAEKDPEEVVKLLRSNNYDHDELIKVTFQDFELSESSINENRNLHKFKEIRKKQVVIK